MKNSIFTLLLISLFAFTACNEMASDEKELRDFIHLCDLIYPISYELADGTIITIYDKEDEDCTKLCQDDDKKATAKTGDDKAGDDKKSDLDEDKDAKLIYPIQFMDHTGTTLTINTDKELEKAFEDCEEYYEDLKNRNDDHDDECG